jgi:hypothetical protein
MMNNSTSSARLTPPVGGGSVWTTSLSNNRFRASRPPWCTTVAAPATRSDAAHRRRGTARAAARPEHRRPIRPGGALPRRCLRAPVRAAVPAGRAGLVWVDAFHRDWDDFLPSRVWPRASSWHLLWSRSSRCARPLSKMIAGLLADYSEHLRQRLIDAHVSDEWLQVGFAERGTIVGPRRRTAGRTGHSRCSGGRSHRGGHRPLPACADVGADVAAGPDLSVAKVFKGVSRSLSDAGADR